MRSLWGDAIRRGAVEEVLWVLESAILWASLPGHGVEGAQERLQTSMRLCAYFKRELAVLYIVHCTKRNVLSVFGLD